MISIISVALFGVILVPLLASGFRKNISSFSPILAELRKINFVDFPIYGGTLRRNVEGDLPTRPPQIATASSTKRALCAPFC
jgi:hypothetical protein